MRNCGMCQKGWARYWDGERWAHRHPEGLAVKSYCRRKDPPPRVKPPEKAPKPAPRATLSASVAKATRGGVSPRVATPKNNAAYPPLMGGKTGPTTAAPRGAKRRGRQAVNLHPELDDLTTVEGRLRALRRRAALTGGRT